MFPNLNGRLVVERMFARESAILDGLLNSLSTPVPVIQLHLAELAARWIIPCKKSMIYTFANLLLTWLKFLLMIDKYSCEFALQELAFRDFLTSHGVDQSAFNSPTFNCNSIKLDLVKFRIFNGD